MFGKTRLGKSNVVKLIVQSLIETTKEKKNVGQLIFDINGEYANDNPQDDNLSVAGVYPDNCVIYALIAKPKTKSKKLKIDFYDHPERSHKIISTLLKEAGRNSIYIERFLSVDIPALSTLAELNFGEKDRAERKILMYWAVLKKAGFTADESKLKSKLPFGIQLNKKAMEKVFGESEENWIKPKNLDELVAFFEKVAESDRTEKLASSTKGKNLFDSDDEAILNFLKPASAISAGPGLLQNIRIYHDDKAGNFFVEIIKELDEGKTVIIDLGNANEEVMQYFSRELSESVFRHQTTKFTSNTLGDHFIQLYFEEAHNLLKIMMIPKKRVYIGDSQKKARNIT